MIQGLLYVLLCFVLCFVLSQARFCFSVLFLSSRKYLGILIFGAFFFSLGCTSLLLKAYEGVFPEFRVLMTSTKQNVELPAVDREMESTCITAQVPGEVLASWEFISFLLRGWLQSDHGLGGSVSSGFFLTICCLSEALAPQQRK